MNFNYYNIKQKCKKILGDLVFYGAGYSIAGAVSGAVGSKLLSKAGQLDPRPQDKDDEIAIIVEMMRVGAAGNTVMGAAMAIARMILVETGLNWQPHHKKKIVKLFAQMILNMGVIITGSALGHTMLENIASMSLEKTVAAFAVGTSTFVGACTVLILLAGCCIGTGVLGTFTYGRCTQKPAPSLKDAYSQLFNFFGENTQRQTNRQTHVGAPVVEPSTLQPPPISQNELEEVVAGPSAPRPTNQCEIEIVPCVAGPSTLRPGL